MAYPKKPEAEKARLVTFSFAPGVIAKLDALAAADAAVEGRAPNRSAFVARLVVAEDARRVRCYEGPRIATVIACDRRRLEFDGAGRRSRAA
jgi:hypothetical protein